MSASDSHKGATGGAAAVVFSVSRLSQGTLQLLHIVLLVASSLMLSQKHSFIGDIFLKDIQC